MRDIIIFALPALVLACMSVPLAANGQQVNTVGLREITRAVQDLCLHPDREGEVEGGFLVRLVGTRIQGTVEVEQWEGFHERLGDFNSTQHLDCTMYVLPILLETFGVPDDQAGAIRTCIQERVTNEISQPFSIPAGVRCPGGGCFLESSNCNNRATDLRYIAPSGYFIDEYSFVQGARHYGNTGGLDVQTGDSGRTSRISVRLSCSPPDRIGAPGGWNNGELRGTISYLDLNELRHRTSGECALQVGG